MIQLSRFHKGKNISRQVSIRDLGIVFCLRLNIYVHNELISKEDLVENPLQISKYFCSIFDFISFAKNFNNHLYEVGSIKFFQGCFADNLRMCEGRFYIHFNLIFTSHFHHFSPTTFSTTIFATASDHFFDVTNRLSRSP